jgi:hypothetical protein
MDPSVMTPAVRLKRLANSLEVTETIERIISSDLVKKEQARLLLLSGAMDALIRMEHADRKLSKTALARRK